MSSENIGLIEDQAQNFVVIVNYGRIHKDMIGCRTTRGDWPQASSPDNAVGVRRWQSDVSICTSPANGISATPHKRECQNTQPS